jgi:hypothetical protein
MRSSSYDHHGISIDEAFIPADVTWVYGSTEENRQNYINELIDENMKDYVSHIDKITKSRNMRGNFTDEETKIIVIHNLKNANISEQNICSLIDGGCFGLDRYSWDSTYISPEKVYISAEKLPEQIYARAQYKERVIRRVTRIIKLD